MLTRRDMLRTLAASAVVLAAGEATATSDAKTVIVRMLATIAGYCRLRLGP